MNRSVTTGTARTGLRGAAIGLLLVAILATLAACSPSGPSSPDPNLSLAEYRYGVAPVRSDEVTYQPDVIIPGGGAESVRSVSGDGMTWVLDGGADGVDQLVPGKIMFVTNRGAGRVLGVRKVGKDVAVTIGPTALTDVIAKADVHYDVDLDPSTIQFRAGPDVPGNVVDPRPSAAAAGTSDVSGSTTGSPDSTVPDTTTTPSTETSTTAAAPANFHSFVGPAVIRPLAVTATSAPGPIPAAPLPFPTPTPPVVPIKGLKMQSLSSDYGFGVQVSYDKGGVKVFGRGVVYISHPKLVFDLVITPTGGIVTAKVELHGAAGIRIDFQAGSTVGLTGNIHELAQLPVDLTIPIPTVGPGLPLAVTLHQEFLIQTVFSAKNSTLSFNGDYGFEGAIGFGLDHGKFGAFAPSGFHVRKSMLQSVDGRSVGVNGLVLGYQLKVIVGIGGWGFAVGPYFSIDAGIGVANGSDLGIVKCRGATFDLKLGYGVGYSMPAPVADAINFFLRALNFRQIKRTGGTPPITQRLIRKSGYAPNLPICAAAV